MSRRAAEHALHQMKAFVRAYGPESGAEGPVRFVREVLGVEPDVWQAEVLRDFGRGERNVAIKACHGVGKTAVMSWLVLLMLTTRFPMKTVATAPTRSQMFDNLYAEVVTWFGKLPEALQSLYSVKTDRIEFLPRPKDSFFSARTAKAEQPEALQGIHRDDGYVLILVDEASGVAEAIFESGSGSMSGPNVMTLMIANPQRTTGYFADAFGRMRDVWKRYHVTSIHGVWPEDEGPSPETYISDRPTKEYEKEQAIRFGIDSDAYRIRVLGEFPKADEDTVIPLFLVESAERRDIVVARDAPSVWGVDVARFGSNRNALVDRTRRAVRDVDVWQKMDLMATVGRIKNRWDNTRPSDRPGTIIVDVNGIGGGVVDRLWEMGLPVRGVNVSESASASDRFNRSRDELWWTAREWLEGKDVTLPTVDDPDSPIEALKAELIQPRYTFMSNGKIKVESKDEMKKRKVRSPDLADAFVLTFAEDLALASGPGAIGESMSWGEELPSRVTDVP